jgi:hypothetical protein
MSFDFGSVAGEMVDAIKKNASDESGKISGYARTIVEKEKVILEELAQARLANDISEQEFKDEMEREKKVLQAELLTFEIMSKAMAQKAVNAAVNVFINAIKLAI